MIEDVDIIRNEQEQMEKDISAVQSRWNHLREKKIEIANKLSNIKRAEEELDRMSGEKSQVELDLKVSSFC